MVQIWRKEMLLNQRKANICIYYMSKNTWTYFLDLLDMVELADDWSAISGYADL